MAQDRVVLTVLFIIIASRLERAEASPLVEHEWGFIRIEGGYFH